MNIPDVKSALLYNTVSQHFQSSYRQKYMCELELDAADTVLDVGCGSGISCKEIAGKVTSVTGFDISSEMIEAAKICNSSENIEYHVADAETFIDQVPKWKNAVFDKIMCFYVLNWCANPKKVLENILECLKPDGRVLMVFATQTRMLSLKCSYGETVDSWLRRHPKWGPHLKNYEHYQTNWETGEEFLDTLRSVGYDVCKSSSEAHALLPLVDENQHDEMNDLLRTLLKHVNEVPNDLRDECVNDIRRWLRDVTSDRPTSEIITVVAQRKDTYPENMPKTP